MSQPHNEFMVLQIETSGDILLMEKEILRLLGCGVPGCVPACMRSQQYIEMRLRLIDAVRTKGRFNREYRSEIVNLDQGLFVAVEQVRDETVVSFRWQYSTYPNQYEWGRLNGGVELDGLGGRVGGMLPSKRKRGDNASPMETIAE